MEHVFTSLAVNAHPSYRIRVVQCPKCLRCWVRNVHTSLVEGEWLCPRGWRKEGGCASDRFVVVDRPEVEAAYLLTGRYGFGDMEGHP